MTHTRLHVRRQPGPGEPLVHLHGLGGSSLNFVPLMESLAEPRELAPDQYAPDLPGFGHSPPPDDGDLSPAGQARVIIAWLDGLGVGPVHLTGNSLGGAIAVLIAAGRPDLVRSLTLLSPALPDLRPGMQRLQVATVALPVLGRPIAKALVGMDPDRRVEAMLDWLYADPSVVGADERAAAAAEFARRARLPYAPDVLVSATRGAVRSYLGWGPERVWEAARSVTAPTLLVFAAADRLVDARVSRRAYAAFRNAKVHHVVNAGHVPQLEQPALIARLLRRHVAAASGRRRVARLLAAAGLPADADLQPLGERGHSLAVRPRADRAVAAAEPVAVLRPFWPGDEPPLHAGAAVEAAAAAGLGAELLARTADGLVLSWVPGSALGPAALLGSDGATVRRGVAAALRALHSLTPPAGAVPLDPPQWRERYRARLAERAIPEPAGYGDRVAALPPWPPGPSVCSHGDAVAANLIDDGGRVRLIDFEHTGMAPPEYDLATVAIAAGLGPADIADLLAQYGPGADPDRYAVVAAHLRAAWLPWALLPPQAGSERAAPWAAWG